MKYENKKRKMLLISISVIVISLSLLLYKTFSSFIKKTEFPITNDNVNFAFYKKGESTDTMPEKGNSENLGFDHAECDNGAEIVWNKKEWAPVFKNLTQNKTQCSLYFEEQPGKVAVKYITELASTDPTNLKADDTDDANIRYVGASPNNFVYFNNNEKWRIIGIINGKLKIIRNESIGNMAWDTNDNTWSSSTLANYLNNEYNVIDDDLAVIENWNVGRADNGYTAKEYYNYEQDETWTGKVGLMSVSDYGYAVGNSAREKCLGSTLFEYNNGSCEENNWIYHMIGNTSGWTINAFTPEEPGAFYVYDNGRVSLSVVNQKYSVFPAVYLNEDVRIIDGTGEEGSPFILE